MEFVRAASCVFFPRAQLRFTQQKVASSPEKALVTARDVEREQPTDTSCLGYEMQLTAAVIIH